jgi:glutamate racemase
MSDSPILFLDSGIGGLAYYRYFHARNPAETIIYLADRLNFPYGTKERTGLAAVICSLVEKLHHKFRPKLVVIACNTASVSALDTLRATFRDLPFVGTVPAVKPAVQESRTRRIGVLGTERTIEDPYIARLASRYGQDCTITGLAAPELVEFVEHGISGATALERRRAVLPFIEQFRRCGVDAVVLGCTHFLFLREEFAQAGAPEMRIYDSVAGVARRAELLLEPLGRPESGTPQRSLLLVTGTMPLEGAWLHYAQSFDLELRLLQDIL